MSLFFTLVLILAMALAANGCGGTKNKEPLGLYLLNPIASEGHGLKMEKDRLVFENKVVRVSVRQVLSAGMGKGSDFFAILLKARFILVEMEITNKGKKKIIYNPLMTHLLAGSMDYKKPLDYPDLYMIASSLVQGSAPDGILRSIRGSYYDLNTNLGPGEKASKYMVFRPFAEKNKQAVIVLKELYVGTDAVVLTFPFDMVKAASLRK